MSPLSSGRAALAYSALSCSTNALAIACKYVSQRRQFSNPSDKSAKEYLLIDYPLTRFRLIPLVAQNFVAYISGRFIAEMYLENT
jgi:alkylation response protein AidB-like acyl-CoA dehydrogenase